MYIQLTANDLRKKYELPDNYAVHGILAIGTWSAYTPLNLEHLISVLRDLGQDFSYRQLTHPHLHEVYEFTIGDRVVWFFGVMGTSVMSEYLHKGSLLGSQKNILIGSVGALAPACIPGDIIIPNMSHGNQNAGYYQRANTDGLYRPDDSLVESLRSRLDESHTVHIGKTTTCEILMAETSEDIRQWSQDGYLGVEMEAALLFSLSSHFTIPSAALLNIGDNLVREVTFFSDQHQSTLDAFESSRRATIDAAVRELLA